MLFHADNPSTSTPYYRPDPRIITHPLCVLLTTDPDDICVCINSQRVHIKHYLSKHSYGGDVIKFSGDALTVVWFVQDREAPSLSEATLMAARCTDALHTAIEDMEGNPGLSLHIGLGAGRLTCVEVGGAYKRMEFVLAGAPMGQISIAEPLAVGWETVISPEAYALVNPGEIEAALVSELPQSYYDTMLCKSENPEYQEEERRARREEHRADHARGYVVPSRLYRSTFLCCVCEATFLSTPILLWTVQ